MLKFYDRENEMEFLETVEQRSQQSAQMTFVVGRRRVGKRHCLTELLPPQKHSISL
jgi:AAA+ ATPase superfamily predicted ATPase